MTVAAVQQSTITNNNENFIKTTYNGISILVRESDNYVNVSKMTRELTKDRKRIDKLTCGNSSWNEYFEEFCSRNRLGNLDQTTYLYKLHKGYPNDLRGWYVHPKLVNYIAIWASPKYAVVVGEIMDAINERGIAKGISFDENAKELIDRLNEEITMLKEDIKYRDDYIAKTSVPEENCAKMLYIIIEGEYMKISANSTKVPKTYSYKFTFPASMNVKQILKSRYGSLKKLHISCLENLLMNIRVLNPK